MMTDSPQNDSERRRWPRRTVLWPAQLQVGSETYKCWIRNISTSGVALQADVSLTKQLPVSVILERQGQFDGFVIWTGTNLHGIHFVESPEHVVQRFGDDAETLGLV
jgi:PilZ domain